MSQDLWGHTANLDPFQHGGCIEYAHALKQRFPHLQLGTLTTPDDEDDWQHVFMHDGRNAYDSAGTHPMPYHGVGGQWEPHDDADFDWYDEPEPSLLAAAHKHIERNGIGPRTASRTAMPIDDFHIHEDVPGKVWKAYDGPESPGCGKHCYYIPQIGKLVTDRHEGQPFLSWVSTHENHQRRGIARALWETAGRPLHVPGTQTDEGKAWADRVGGDNLWWSGNEHLRHASRTASHTAARLAMPWYHNTDAELNPGDELLPASQRGHKSEWESQSTNAETGQSTPLYPHYDPHSVYLYNEHGDPGDYEDFGQHRYEAEPIGQTKPDPEHESMRQQALEELAEVHGVSLDEAKSLLHEDDIGGMHSYVAPRARIIRKINPKEAHLMTAAVTVYTKPDCPQCSMTKKQLDKLGIDHDTVDVTTDPDAHAYVTGLGYASAPVVVVNNGEAHWSGFRPDHLRGLIE